jgi:ethanolamine utilization protein EutA
MVEDSVTDMKSEVISTVNDFFEKHFTEQAEKMSSSFERNYDELLNQGGLSDLSEVERIRRLIVSFKPALTSVLEPCEEYDKLLTMLLYIFKARWEGANRRKKRSPAKRQGPVMPGSDRTFNIVFTCAVCGQEIEVPYEKKREIMTSEDTVDIPKHCGQELNMRITRAQEEKPVRSTYEEKIEPVELLMGHIPADNVHYMKILSVGIDVGSSTSHLVFSRLTLKRETSFLNITNRFNLVNREVIYESSIIFTPLIDRYTIDIDAVVDFCKEEYKRAGMSPELIETGAVIVTGEAARKKNASEIVDRLASGSGKFVSATAGPNLESVLSARGSGVVDTSRTQQCTIMNIDVGGGSSKLAIASRGQVLSTSSISIGGRLLGVDKNLKVWRIDDPTQFVMKELGMNYEVGDTIAEEDARTIARVYAETLMEVIQGPARSTIARELMMTDDLDFSIPIDAYSFSGGVAEMYFGSNEAFDDIGGMLAEEVRTLVEAKSLKVIEPQNKIRATVIGAGAFSLSVSGSTCYFDKSIEFPIRNIPVIPVNVTTDNYKPGIVEKEVKRAYAMFDMEEGKDIGALYFGDPLYRSYSWLQEFVKAIEAALPTAVATKKMVILLFAGDMGKMVGLMTRRETLIQHNLICLDELLLESGDWIDIGAPLSSGQVFPITVKSIVFNANKEFS